MFNEEILEKITIDILYQLGYECINGYEIQRTDFSKIILEEDLEKVMLKINHNINEEQIQEAIRKVKNLESNNTILNNKQFTKYLFEGCKIAIQDNGETRYKTVKIIDFDNVQNNIFKAINQYTIIEHSKRRPDIIIFINGIPLVVIELKSTVREEVKLIDAYNQLKGYQEVHIPSLFYYNQFIIVSDGVQAKAGTITSPWSRFTEWKKEEDIDEVKENMSTYETMFKGMLRRERLLDIIQNFILWSENNKILSAYHQYFGVKRAIKNTEKAIHNNTGKAGLLWHTQGSGKSFSMVFYIGNMIRILNKASIIIITDRSDLDNQLFTTFAKCVEYFKQEPIQIESREQLNEKLEGRKSGGIFFTTLQKFEKNTGLFSERDDILVVVDEAHRSHYGLDAIIKLDKENMKAYKKYGTAKYLHKAFPNATYIGFTGTPIETKEKSTTNIFGDIIDTYDMTQSIVDGATVPIMYESRIAKVGLNQKILDDIDDYYTYLETEEDIEDYKIEESKRNMATMQQIIENPDRLEIIVKDIINHYEGIETSVANKAMIVAYSRDSAYTMYNKFLKLRPSWKDKIHMIITPSNKDSKEMQKVIGTKSRQKQLEVEFKDPDSEFKIVIVVNMWLTGFDVPALGTMYIDKPMKSHNLMQAIARVNRVYKNKMGGLIVDYIGVKNWLLDALKTYTKRDQVKIAENSEFVKILNDKVELIEDLFSGFYYNHFTEATDSDRYKIIMEGANWILKTEESKKKFMKYSYDVKSLYTLCTGVISQEIKEEILFFVSVRSFISKISGGKIDVKEINANVAKMLEKAIQDDEILQIGEVCNSNRLVMLSNELINKISKMQQKNIAIEILNRVLKKYIEQIGRQNVVMMEKFSIKFQKIVDTYNERTIIEDIERMLQEVINLKNEIDEALKAGNEYNLSEEEKAFFDALGNDPEVKELMKDEVLVQIAKELVETVNRNITIDWDVRQDARARMRIEIKKLLIKYNYPPNKSEKAIQTVIKQAELKCHALIKE